MNKFYVLATPIGNLKDISERALEVLRQVDLILCEDTRVTKKLLNYFEISKPTLSYHQHSKLSRVNSIIEKIRAGQSLALVSDAGTPAISDPGGKLVERITKELAVEVIAVPGACAAIAALSICGFSADRFVFLGFPPAKKKRTKFFKEMIDSERTIVFYESAYRIVKTLKDLEEIIPERDIMVARELTKQFETIYRGQVNEVIGKISPDQVRGEFVIVVKSKKC